MANLLRQIGVLTGWLVLLAAAPPFSHKVHLAKKVECVVCHSGAPASKTAADNLIPANTVCAGCHTDDRKDFQPKAPRQTTVTKFNHQQHVRLGTCAGCHQGLATADATSLANFPRMESCLVCHNKIDNPFSCEKCHTQSPEQLKPASHSTGYLDRHSNKAVEKVGCDVCHGRRFSCLGCH